MKATSKPEPATVEDESRGIGGVWTMDPATGLKSRPQPQPQPVTDGLQDEAPDDPGKE